MSSHNYIAILPYCCHAIDIHAVDIVPAVASDLSSDLDQTVQWGKDWLVTFNASKTKLVSFNHQINACAFLQLTWIGHLLTKPLALIVFLALNLLLIFDGTPISVRLPRQLGKWLGRSIILKNI